MKEFSLTYARKHLETLLELAEQGQEVVITKYGKPVAKLVSTQQVKKVRLGFRPLKLESDFLEPTDDAVVESFHK